MAAQLMGIIGLPCRGDQAWIRRARTSLPVPVSPVSRTGIDVGATCAAFAITRRDDSLTVTSVSALGTAVAGAINSWTRAARRAGAFPACASMTSYAPRSTASTRQESLTGLSHHQIQRAA